MLCIIPYTTVLLKLQYLSIGLIIRPTIWTSLGLIQNYRWQSEVKIEKNLSLNSTVKTNWRTKLCPHQNCMCMVFNFSSYSGLQKNALKCWYLDHKLHHLALHVWHMQSILYEILRCVLPPQTCLGLQILQLKSFER